MGAVDAFLVAARVKRQTEIIRVTQRRHKDRHDDGEQRFDTSGRRTGLDRAAAGRLRVDDRLGLVAERRQEPQRKTHHQSHFLRVPADLSERHQQGAERIRHRGGGRRRKEHGTQDDHQRETARIQHRDHEPAGGDRQRADMRKRLAGAGEEHVHQAHHREYDQEHAHGRQQTQRMQPGGRHDACGQDGAHRQLRRPGDDECGEHQRQERHHLRARIQGRYE